jgi:hypothetical protein
VIDSPTSKETPEPRGKRSGRSPSPHGDFSIADAEVKVSFMTLFLSTSGQFWAIRFNFRMEKPNDFQMYERNEVTVLSIRAAS